MGGAFTTVGGAPYNRLCKISTSGSVVSSFNPDLNNSVRTMALDGSGNLYAGGDFTTVGGVTYNRLCKFDVTGAIVTGFNPNINEAVSSLATDASNNIYVGGYFTASGAIPRSRLCQFDATGVLTSFNPNMNSDVPSLIFMPNGDLYASGFFTSPSVRLAVFSAPTVLPVEWVSFLGKKGVEGNVLVWETASETANKGFQIERLSATGDAWEVLGFVSGANKSARYSFTDRAPLSISTYRLRQIEYNGKERFSKVITVENTVSESE